MKLKICGLTKPEEAKWVAEAKADFAGFVMFFPKSKRNLQPEQAKLILKELPETVSSVAVVVSPTEEQVKVIESLGFDFIQIHGELSEAVLKSCEIPVIRAFNVDNLPLYESYLKEEKMKGFVLDAPEPGSGKTFDWNIVKDLPKTEKFIMLSGGLNVENVGKAMKEVKPDGIDVSSGVEYTDGRPGKDPEKIKTFGKIVKG